MDSLDTLSEQEFSTLIDYLDERTVRELKVNDLYLRVVEKKLAQMVATKNYELKLKEQTAAKEIAAIETEVAKIQVELNKESLTDAEINTYKKQLKQFGVALMTLEGQRKECRDQQAANYDAQTRLNRARVGKSGQMTNIRGSVFATRNPDNRNEIQKLAEIEQAKLQAQRKEDFIEAHKHHNEMIDFMESNTSEQPIFHFGGKPVIVISAGKFKSERTGDVTITSDKKDMTKSMALLAMAGLGTFATAEQLYEYYTTVNFDAEKITEASKKMQEILDTLQKAEEMNIIEPTKVAQPDFISSLITGGAITGKYAQEIAQNKQHNVQTAKPKINTQEHEKNQGEVR